MRDHGTPDNERWEWRRTGLRRYGPLAAALARNGGPDPYSERALTNVSGFSGADGVFLGVMARRIDPANYEKFFASVTLGPGSAISMFHGDGTMLARFPHVEELIGKKFKSAPLMQAVLESASGVVEQLTLAVTTDNLAAIALYRELGFEAYGTEPRALKSADGYADDVLMVRFLVNARRTFAP